MANVTMSVFRGDPRGGQFVTYEVDAEEGQVVVGRMPEAKPALGKERGQVERRGGAWRKPHGSRAGPS